MIPMSALAQNPVVPVLDALIPDKEKVDDETQWRVVLADHFGTEEINDNAVRFTAEWNYLDGAPGMTHFDFLLFRDRTPVTTTNFLGYVNRGDYLNMVIHRWVRDFVLQGGGFTITEGAERPVSGKVPTQAPIVNEFGVSNTLATVSMAKLGGDPDSATSQWFVSTGANSDNLDFQNGGFTVFGRISQETFSNVMDLNDGVEFAPFNLGGAFSGTPLVTGTTDENFTADRFFRFLSTVEIPLPAGQAGVDTALTYRIVSEVGDGSVSGSIVDGEFVVDFLESQISGRRTFVIQAEDSVGNQVVDTFTVEDFASYEEWRRDQYRGADFLDEEISGPLADPNADGVTNFALYVSGLPATGDQSQKVKAPTVTIVGSNTQLKFEVAIGLRGVGFILEQSSDLENWSDVVGATETREKLDDRDSLKFTVPGTPASNSKVFYRVRFTQTTP